MIEWISAILILVGAAFSLLAAVGIWRMPDFFSRLQTSTKASTLGVGSLVLAAAVQFGGTGTTTRALLVVAFVALTVPIAAQMIGHAAYAEGVPMWEGTIVDELASPEGDTAPGAEDRP
jgi:multicomponent Na+:H+ antiporter subunit G